MTIRQWLHHRARNPRQNFTLLLVGFALFTLGFVLVVSAQHALSSSGLLSELVALAGLIVIGAGIIIAAIGYLSLSLLRIISFLDNKHE